MMRVFDRQQILYKRSRKFQKSDKNPYFLHDWASQELSDRLLFIKKEFPTILQIGTRGKNLKDTISGHHFFCLSDIVKNKNMIDVVYDEEFLPFKDNVFDLIVSSLNLHTVNDLPGTLLQIKKCLKLDGLFLASILGGETLFELRDCFAKAEIELSSGITPRIAPFADKQQIGALLQRAGFSLPVIDSEIIRVTYNTIFDLMHDLRGMGETNIISSRKKNFSRRELFLRAGEIYKEKYVQSDGRIVASFEIIFMTGWSPHESQQKPLKPGSAALRLSDALGAKEIGANDFIAPKTSS